MTPILLNSLIQDLDLFGLEYPDVNRNMVENLTIQARDFINDIFELGMSCYKGLDGINPSFPLKKEGAEVKN